MIPHLPVQPAAVLLISVLLFLPLAAFLLRNVCGLFTGEVPSYRRAIAAAIVVGAGAFFAFDLASYGFSLVAHNIRPEMAPPYKTWLQAPLDLKWQVMSQKPATRVFAFIFTLAVAGMLQVFFLKVPFRQGVAMLCLWWGANVLAFSIILFVVTITLESLDVGLQPRFASTSGSDPKSAVGSKNTRATQPGSAPTERKQATDAKTAPPDASKPAQQENEFEQTWVGARDRLNGYLAPLKTEMEPITRRLPQPMQGFLENGGWWFVLGAILLVALLWVRSVWRKLSRALRRRMKPREPKEEGWVKQLRVDLADFELPARAGARRAIVKGLPAYIGLVVIAPAGKDVDDLHPEMADTLLDWIKPGLAEVAAHDGPEVKIWERQYSSGGFPKAFHHHVRIPEPPGRRSHWILLAGTLSIGDQTIHLGLGLFADEPNNIRHIVVRNEQWLDVLTITEKQRKTNRRHNELIARRDQDLRPERAGIKAKR